MIVTLLRQSHRRRTGKRSSDGAAAPALSPAPDRPSPPPTPRTKRWPAVLASTAALTGYLTLLGGLLLAIRFKHAGLPVTQAVSAVPVATLVTTALIEIFVPLLVFVGALLISLASALPAAKAATKSRAQPQQGSFDKWFGRIARPFAALLVLGAVPFNVWGVTFFLAMMVILFAGRWMPRLDRHPRLSAPRSAAISIVILLAAASIPVLARQAVEPLNMERVTIERPGERPLVADLVAIRDTSVVVGRCHELYVLPTPASMRVEHLPSSWSSGESIFERLGVGANKPVKPRPMPC